MKKTLLALLALAAPVVATAQTNARAISLPDALEMAKRNSPTMINARGTIRTNAAAITVAKWAFAPTLSVSYGSSTSGGGNYVNGQLVTQANKGYNFNQSLGGISIPVWDGGQRLYTLRQRQASLTQSEVAEVSSEFSIAQQVKQQYYSILQALESESAARAQLQQATEQLSASVARVVNGTANISDTLSAKVSVGNAQIAILTALNSESNGNAQLTRLTGSDSPLTAIVADTADPQPLHVTDAELFALVDQGPSVKQAVASLVVSRASEKVSRSSYWPQITLNGSFSRNNSDMHYDFGSGPMNYSWTVSLGASYQLWNGYSRESGVISARASLDNAEANLRDAKLTARQNLTQQLGTLHTAEAQIAIQRLNLVAATEALRVVQQRYAQGVGTILDLLTAQSTYNSARSTLITQRFNARNARAQIEALVGRDVQ